MGPGLQPATRCLAVVVVFMIVPIADRVSAPFGVPVLQPCPKEEMIHKPAVGPVAEGVDDISAIGHPLDMHVRPPRIGACLQFSEFAGETSRLGLLRQFVDQCFGRYLSGERVPGRCHQPANRSNGRPAPVPGPKQVVVQHRHNALKMSPRSPRRLAHHLKKRNRP